jgi:hypothetical protein
LTKENPFFERIGAKIMAKLTLSGAVCELDRRLVAIETQIGNLQRLLDDHMKSDKVMDQVATSLNEAYRLWIEQHLNMGGNSDYTPINATVLSHFLTQQVGDVYQYKVKGDFQVLILGWSVPVQPDPCRDITVTTDKRCLLRVKAHLIHNTLYHQLYLLDQIVTFSGYVEFEMVYLPGVGDQPLGYVIGKKSDILPLQNPIKHP